MKTYTLIDAHTHVFPDPIADKAAVSIGDFYDCPPAHSASVKSLLETGAKYNISHYLICSAALSPHQTDSINAFMAQLNKDARFTALGTLHPLMDNWEQTLESVKALGLCGIKLHSDMQRFNLDDDHMLPKYRKMAQMGLPVLFHMGDPRYDYSSPTRLANVLKKVPDLVCIAAHMGGYQRWDEAYDVLPVLDNLYFDTSSAVALMPTAKAYRLMEKHGIQKFMFGSDHPLWDAGGEFAPLAALGLTDPECTALFSENFKKLFHL